MKSLPDFFRTGTLGIGNHPYREMLSLQRQMDRLFNDMWVTPAFAPTCDVTETESHYLMSFDLPGVKQEDIKIDLGGDMLTVSAERKEEHQGSCGQKGKNQCLSERFYGSFARSFQLPPGVRAEQIEANYADGVLRLAVPKTEVARTRSIKIGDGKSRLWDKLLGRKKEEAQAAPSSQTQSKGQFQAPSEKRSSEKVA